MPNKQVSIDALPATDHFWMCYAEGAFGPKKRHPSLAAACIEADRLATQTGRRIFIHEGIGCVLPEIPLSERPKPQKEAVAVKKE